MVYVRLYVEELTPDGQGGLYQAFCQLKERLKRRLLHLNIKDIPYLPQRVGVITSQPGLPGDLITVIGRRFRNAGGAYQRSRGGCSRDLFRSQALHKRQDIDVVIMGRGGSLELWAFNTEEVAALFFIPRFRWSVL